MRLNKQSNVKSAKSPDRKTIREWEQQYGIFILDLDGFDKTDPKLYERLFTQSEFEQAAAECTIMERKVSTAPSQDAEKLRRKPPKPKNTETKAAVEPAESRQRVKNWSKRPLLWLLILFTLPTLAVLGLNWVYQKLQSRWAIPWYVPASILGLDLFILMIQPISPFISGPFYVWYLVLNEVSTLLHGVVTFVKVSVLHQPPGLTSASPVPFLSSVSLAGNAVPLYFSTGSALTSSVFIATVLSFGRDALHRLVTLRRT